MPVRAAEVSERIAPRGTSTTRSDAAPRSQPFVVAAVAATVFLTAVAEGGYSEEARAALAILVWTSVLVGFGLRRLPRSRPPDAAVVAGALLALLGLLTASSVAWASDDAAVVDEVVRIGGYLGLFALVVCSSRDGEVRPWLTGLAIGIGAIALLALLSRLAPFLPGGDEEIAAALPSARGRLSFPIGYWNGLAALVALGVVLLTWLAAFAPTRRTRTGATAALPMLSLTIYLTSSRGAFIALAAGVLVLLALGPRRIAIAGSALLGLIGAVIAIELAGTQAALIEGETGGRASREGLIMLVAGAGVTALIAAARAAADAGLMRARGPRIGRRLAIAGGASLLAAAVIVSAPAERFEEFKRLPPETETAAAGNLDRVSGSGRWQFWSVAADAFESAPLHGIGAGAYETYWNQHAPITQMASQAHSLYLEMLAELGPAALLALVAFLALGPVRCVRDRSVFSDPEAVPAAVAIVCAGAVSAGIDWTWELPAVFGPVIAASALLTGAAFAPAALMQLRAHPARANGAGRSHRVRLRRPRAAALTAIGFAVLLVAVNALLAERRIAASQAAARDGDPGRAAEAAEAAIALRPWDPDARVQLALLQENAGRLDDAERSIGEAIERSPEDWILWVIRGRIASLDARPTEAIAAYSRVIELNPRWADAAGLTDALTPTPPAQSPPGTPPSGSPPPSPPANEGGGR